MGSRAIYGGPPREKQAGTFKRNAIHPSYRYFMMPQGVESSGDLAI
jgi:hypothetical protein